MPMDMIPGRVTVILLGLGDDPNGLDKKQCMKLVANIESACNLDWTWDGINDYCDELDREIDDDIENDAALRADYYRSVMPRY